jgi:U3 small nucleolar RNA-associated protein 22
LQKSHKIVIPFPNPKPDNDTPYKLLYSPPSRINIVGSYASKTMVEIGSLPSVDMAVTMPASIFREKDFLNYCYFYKRAFYLAYLAAGLQENAGNDFEFSFSYLGGNLLQPILLVKPGRGNRIAVDALYANLIQSMTKVNP